MNKLSPIIFILILFLSASISYSQKNTVIRFPQQELDNMSKSFLSSKPYPQPQPQPKSSVTPGIRQLLIKHNELRKISVHPFDKKITDTLYILHDTAISGIWTHKGPIVITSNVALSFFKANATILGDMILWGDSAKLIVDSSYLYIPQQYFYQRSLIAVLASHVIIRNSTLDYSNLSHNLLATYNAKIEMKNVTNIGFTTNGIWQNASVSIDGTNQAGEYIITDYVRLSFRNANTILLWHHFPDTSRINYSFPKGDTVKSYVFNKTIAGIKGIEYDIKVSDCTDVMWGMMPSGGSDITISNSLIRSIGLWFTGNDTINVSGLVDNSKYTDFTAPLPDRNLRLISSSVQTWSLYPMQKTHLNITGCILGEVGAENRAYIVGSGFFVDGSGGYFWSSDTSFVVAMGASATTFVRSQVSSIFIFGYSALTNGIAQAIGNSILIVAQSSIPQDPAPLEGSVVWFANINKPYQAFVGDIVPVIGSAWIDRGPTSNLMDFNYYRMYYQKSGDVKWTQIGSDYNNEVRYDVLANWNTSGLAPGQYNLKLSLTDNTLQLNTTDAIIQFNLLPSILSSDNIQNNSLSLLVYPNPANHTASISYQLTDKEHITLELFDITGRKIRTLLNNEQDHGMHTLNISISDLSSGIYLVRLSAGKKQISNHRLEVICYK
jgi:hypothetical protein